ncbi:MAG TPA: ABC transporter permease [Spirochaetia bacterium]|nr:ABC transporter permease [Spirochaetia bacterium]
MSGFLAALWVEGLKVRRSRVFPVTIALFAFIAVMMALLMVVANHPELAGRSATMGAKASRLGNGDWASYLALLIQTILALGQMGYGIVTSWIFGREYSDHVVKDLLALPTSRSSIVGAKFVLCMAWCILLSAVLLVTALVTGWAATLPGWSPAAARQAVATFSVGAFLTILLSSPIAFAASASRGVLLPIAVVILLLIVTQLLGMGIPGIMPYFPWAIPAVYSGAAGSALPAASPVSLLILILTFALGVGATTVWWKAADQT